VRLQNKRRKLKGELSADREKTLAEARAEREAAAAERATVDGVVSKLSPIADMWEAVAEGIKKNPGAPQIDFEMADAAFEQNAGISVDDYMRLRARRGLAVPGDARLRAENARLKREAESAKSNGAATPALIAPAVAAPAAKSKDAAEARDWSPELPKDHKLRKIDGWNALLDKEMSKYHDADLDEYSKDPEDVAAKVLKRELAALAAEEEDEEEAPKPRARVKVAAKPEPVARPRKVPVAELPDDDSPEPKGMADRTNWAIDRAMRRARGETVT
jgi:hypothetical protein